MFAKAPVPGAVKTRLAALLGADGAAALHAGLVRRALAAAVSARVGSVELWCSPDESHAFFAQCAREFGITLRRQEGANLGARMGHAVDDALAAGFSSLVIGTDCPALAAEALREAARELRRHDAVLKPAEDGGYVLIGFSRAIPGVFDGIEWGGEHVARDTRERLQRERAGWKELATTWDVDRPEDYARAQAEGLLGVEPC